MGIKYTKEILEQAVAKSVNYSDVLRELGIPSWSGSQWIHIKNRIAHFDIDTAHFTNVPRPKNNGKKHFSEVLIKRDRKLGRTDNKQLRRVCIEAGLAYKCDICNIPPKWNDKDLVLELDHINGDWSDNRIDNLRFLCPNCHSQTPTYKKEININECADCGKQISRKANRCKKCAGVIHSEVMKSIKKTKIEWPSNKDLHKLIKASNKSNVAKQLGVSEAAIRKRLKRREPAGDGTTSTR